MIKYECMSSIQESMRRGLLIPEIPLDKDGNPVVPDPRYEKDYLSVDGNRGFFFRYLDKKKQQEHMILKAISTEEGRKALVDEMVPSIKMALELNAINKSSCEDCEE